MEDTSVVGIGYSGATSKEHRIRVIVVEDDPLMRMAVGLQLEKLNCVHVIASTAEGSDALRLVDSLQPDLVVRDSRAGCAPAFAAQLSGLCPKARLILLMDEATSASPASAIAAEGHVVKADLCRDLRLEIERMFGRPSPCKTGSS